MSTRKPITPAERRRRRNDRQREWRARPGGAAYEARAARRSYWRRVNRWNHGGGGCGTACTVCQRIAEEHALCG